MASYTVVVAFSGKSTVRREKHYVQPYDCDEKQLAKDNILGKFGCRTCILVAVLGNLLESSQTWCRLGGGLRARARLCPLIHVGGARLSIYAGATGRAIWPIARSARCPTKPPCCRIGLPRRLLVAQWLGDGVGAVRRCRSPAAGLAQRRDGEDHGPEDFMFLPDGGSRRGQYIQAMGICVRYSDSATSMQMLS